MYYYIYDNYLNESKYKGALFKIESRLTDLGINGKIVKLSVLKNLQKNISEEINLGIKTIVVVGDDKTFNQVINLIPNLNIIIGYIPVTNTSKIAKITGIPPYSDACNTLSTRIIKKIDLGKINDLYYFFTSLEMPGDNLNIICDNNYFINVEGKNNIITVNNISFENNSDSKVLGNDGLIKLGIKHIEKKWFKPPKETFSKFKAKKINITSDKSIPILIIDEKRIIKPPLEIKITEKKLNLIVGKNRLI